jgi:hypothetical protein
MVSAADPLGRNLDFLDRVASTYAPYLTNIHPNVSFYFPAIPSERLVRD